MAEFWTIVERNTAIRVPKYLKNILMLNGYDDALSIETITTKDIDLFEEFGKNEIDSFIGVNDDPKDFYHIFCDKKDKFKIMRGDRVKLMDVVEFVRKKLASEAGHNFFKQAEKTIQQTSGKTFNTQNYKQIYQNHRIDIKDNTKMTPQSSSKVEVFKEIKGKIGMITPFLITKHEQLDPQTDADLTQTLPNASTRDPLTVPLSPPSNAELPSLTHLTNRIPAQITSNIDVNATSLSSIHVGQYPDVDDKGESNIQKDVSSSVSVQLQNISFGKNHQTKIGKNYACDVCEKVFDRRGHLKRHQIVHSGQKDFACGICQKTFGHDSSLKRHQRVHSGQKDYVCDVCQKTFGHDASLKRHQIVHSGQKDYVCDVCQKTFGHDSSLKRHQLVHSGQKDYVCDVCQKTFSQHSSLKKHQIVHSGQKDYVCDVCQKKFGRLEHLKRHQRIHSDQKDYVCDVCQRVFKHALSLKRHQTIHSSKKPYEVCQQAFNQLSTISSHQKIHNDDKEQFSCAHCGKS